MLICRKIRGGHVIVSSFYLWVVMSYVWFLKYFLKLDHWSLEKTKLCFLCNQKYKIRKEFLKRNYINNTFDRGFIFNL